MSHRILIAEDNPTNMKILMLALEDEGYDIVAASNGKLALELLETSEKPVSVILLDWMMPEMNGMDVLAVLKKDKKYRDIPVIMQTAKAQRDNIVEGMEEGAFQYLTKPFDEELLVSLVKSAVETYEKRAKTTRQPGDKIDSIRDRAMNILRNGSVLRKRLFKESAKEIPSTIAEAKSINNSIINDLQKFIIPTLEGILPVCEESDIILETLNNTASKLTRGSTLMDSIST